MLALARAIQTVRFIRWVLRRLTGHRDKLSRDYEVTRAELMHRDL